MNPKVRRYALLALLWITVVVVLVAARRVLLPFVIAALLAYVLDPIISWLARRPIRGRTVPRWVAVIGVYAFVGVMVWAGIVSLVPQVYREAIRAFADLRDFIAMITPERVEAWAARINETLQAYRIPVDVGSDASSETGRVSLDLAAALADSIQSLGGVLKANVGDIVNFSRILLTGLVQAVFFALLLLMVTAFISIDARHIIPYVKSLVPVEWRSDFEDLLKHIDVGLSGVVRGQLTICLVNGVLTLVGLVLLRVPFAFALAGLAMILTLVPIFGTILSSVPIVLLGLTQSFLTGMLALVWILGIHALEAYFLNPKIMGNASKIHPVLIVLALLVGERSYGLVGALLAVPVASVIVAIFKFVHQRAATLDAA